MENVIIVTDNKRHTQRKMYDALGNDLIKILTELITNSNDSYRRLPKDKLTTIGLKFDNPIYINLYKNDKKIEVIDNAEGMDYNDVINGFQSYGADKSGREKGYKTRGLFGQGASDVLFTQKDSKLISIKNGKAILANFYWDNDERKIKTSEDLSIDKIRKQYNIPNNGTIISFILNEKTKFPNNILNKLKHFYMLRFIMNDRSRTVICRQFNERSKSTEERIYYDFPPKKDEDLLCSEKILFKYDGREFNAELDIYRIDNKNQKMEKYGNLRLLTYDNEDNVYDNKFFDLGDKYPGMENLYGYLRLYGTADVIREKLNAKIPEEILTDTRDGLNIKHDFYKSLKGVIEPLLETQASKITDSKHNLLKSDDFRDHKKMFKELNKYLNEELEEINETETIIGKNPPADGFEFTRERIKITVGKKYSLRLLVNPSIIENGSIINLEYGNDDYINLSPKSININYDKDVNEIIFYSLQISGNRVTDKDCCLLATNGTITKKIFISVVSENIYYPKYGMEFNPSFMTTIPDHEANLHLYIDTNKYPVGSEIKFISTNPKIIINKSKIILSEKDVLFENISKIEVVFRSKDKEVFGKIIANCKNFLTEADVKISESTERNEGRSGLISGWEFTNNPEADWQKYLHPKTGKIIINGDHKINKQYFGEDINIKKIEGNKICQKYLAELISDEVARFMVKKQIEKGQTGKDYEEAIEEHQKRKNKLAGIVYKNVVI